MVVPYRDQPAGLRRLLASLVRARSDRDDIEIVIVDDGSAASAEPVCREAGALRIALERSCGPANARNVGARATAGEILLFLDADVVCPAGLFEAIEAELGRRPEAVALSFLNPPYTRGAGWIANFAAALEHHWLTWYLGGGTAPAPLPGVTTRCSAVRRAAFTAVGGFDATFRTNAIEDFDFGRRIADHGPSLLLAEPWIPHDYPRRASRLARNYWVRTTTFVDYYRRVRPRLHPVQVAAPEAMLRLSGALAATLAIAACFRYSAPLAAAAALLAGGYAWRLRGFLASARRWSGSSAFALGALGLHFASSLPIVAAAAYGIARSLAAAWVSPPRAKAAEGTGPA